jgi:hypothetical protein
MRVLFTILPFALVAAVPAVAAETVPVFAFKTVQLRGGGTLVIRPGPAQRVTIVNGSTQFTRVRIDDRGQLKIDACNDRCPRHYNLRIEVVSPRAPDAAISGGGAISFAPGFGSQGQLSVAVSGGGSIDARAIRAANVNAAVNGGGRVLTGHSSHLSAAVNGGGEVRYAGSPHVSSAVHGGGIVHRGD